MYKNLLNLLVLAVLLPSCNGTAPHISVVCEENNVGNCIVKWEMAPLIKGNVKVYASTNPNHIPEDVPVAEIDKLKPCSRKELKNIGIRTIIDLRSSVEANRQSPLQQAFKVIHIPIPTGDMEYILKGVQEQKIKSDICFDQSQPYPRRCSRCRRQHLRPEDDCHHYRPYTTILLHTCIR